MKQIKVAAAILQKGNKIFIAKRPVTKLPPLVWEFPGGKPEGDETFPQALQRELREELGIETIIGDFITKTTYTYDFAEVEINLFYVRMQDENAVINDSEHVETAWITPQEFDNYEFALADQPLIPLLKKML